MRKSCLILFLLVFVFLPQFFKNNSFAALSTCSATIDISSVNVSSTSDLTFDINNEDINDGRMVWAKITVPSSNFTITGYADNNFDYSLSDSNIIISNFEVGIGNSLNQIVYVVSGDTTAASANWTIEVSDDPTGADSTICTGNLGTSIVDPNNLPPVIASVTISDVTDSSVTVSWSTDTVSTSVLDYGKTSSYGTSQTDSNSVTSHSFSLTSLSANTTYHFNIKATNAFGTTELGDNTFTTAKTGSTGATQTITVTITPTPTPTPIPDTTAPTIYVSTDFSKPFSISPKISGTAKDSKEVSKIEYSLDGGKNYLPVDSTPSLGKKSTDFSFIPDFLDDGNYSLKVRASDLSGNIGFSKTYTLVIDRLNPQVSGVLFSSGPYVLNPKEDGSILVSQSQSFKITLSDVGGSTNIDIFVDDTKKLDSKKFTLTKNSDSGLWSGNILLDKEGEYVLRFSAVDGAGNITDRNLNKVRVTKRGKINASDAKITVFFLDNVKEWRVWDGSSYGQNNPIKTDKNGNYVLFLPTGKYYLQIEVPGFQTQTSDFFTVNNPEPINADFSLNPLKLFLDLKLIRLYWPDFSTQTVPFNNNLPKISLNKNTLVGKQLPFFSLQNSFKSDSLYGRPSVLTYLNLWSPSSTEQISVLNNFSQNKNFNSATIMVGEKSSKVNIFKKRGGYSLNIFADPDALQVDAYKLNVLPTHYFIDRKGIITKVVSGVLNEKEIIEILSN